MDTWHVVVERDDIGRIFRIPIGLGPQGSNQAAKTIPSTSSSSSPRNSNPTFSFTGLASVKHVLSDLFLPAGYPATVSPGKVLRLYNSWKVFNKLVDYLEYQIYNALQAFCNSVSGLLASRGALEGVGVGDASASATYALLLTVLKDAFSRFTTIIAAYYFGTSLYPETKTFRYLADVFNDAGTVLDTLVPFIGSLRLDEHWSVLPSGATLQVVALCLSGGLRSLCSLVAGGSKAALTNHFASPLSGKGDVGEVSAKDASRETVVGLSGMLLGTLLIPYVNTRTSTYTTLFVLVAAHLLFNYLAVRAVVLRTLNRQRTCILWTDWRTPNERSKARALRPADVAPKEMIFGAPDYLRDTITGRKIGRCILGTSFRSVTSRCAVQHIASSLQVFEGEKYVLFVDGGRRRGQRPVTVLVCFKDGYRSMDQLQAWVHSIEVARQLTGSNSEDTADPVDVLRSTLLATREALPGFVRSLVEAGWETEDASMMFGSPNYLMMEMDKYHQDVGVGDEMKKDR